jgi:hypothetical protein
VGDIPLHLPSLAKKDRKAEPSPQGRRAPRSSDKKPREEPTSSGLDIWIPGRWEEGEKIVRLLSRGAIEKGVTRKEEVSRGRNVM